MSIPTGYGARMFVDDRDTLDPNTLLRIAAIADAGSLTAAARVLGVSQPALTKHLHRAEAQLGVTLFQRSMRGVSPTEYGLALLPRARTVRTQMRHARDEIAQLRGRRDGRVTVALNHLATLTLLPGVIRQFRAEWPQAVVQIQPPTFPNRLAELREGSPDFAVMPLPPTPLGAEFVVRRLFTTSVVAMVRPDHPLRRARTLQELTGAEWVLPSQSSSVSVSLANACRAAGLSSPLCPVTCETLTGLETLVAGSDLIGAEPLEVFEARSRASGLLRLPLKQAIEGPSLAFIRWADANPTPAAARLAELFVSAGHGLARRRGRPGRGLA